MSTSRAPKSRSRQTTPQSPPKQSALLSPSRQSRRSTRSQSHEIALSSAQPKRDPKSLAAVTEESDSEDALEVLHPETPIDVQSSASYVDDDTDETSSDGTTQLEALETDLIIDSLPSLHHAATQILSLFDVDNSQDLVTEITSPSSRISKRLTILTGQFNVVRAVYGNGSYINIPLILRKLMSDQPLNNGPWRPDTILQLANLSLLVADLSQKDETLIHDTLERMFNSFPEPFGHFENTVGHTTSTTQLPNDTVAFGIALRTQFFLKVVESKKTHTAFDPDSVLEKVFFDEDENLNVVQGIGDTLLPEAQDAIKRRLDDIRKHFKASSTDPIDLDKLKRKYSWQRFLVETLCWVSPRKQELDAQIIAQGGVNKIQARLLDNDLAPYKEHTPEAQATPDIRVQESRRQNEEQVEATPQHEPEQLQSSRKTALRLTAERVAHLKALKAQEVEVEESSEEELDDWTPTPTKPTSHPTGSAVRPERVIKEIPQSPGVKGGEEDLVDDADYNPVDDDDDDEVEPDKSPTRESSPPKSTLSVLVPTQQTLAVLEVAKQQALLGNKENIDTTRRYTDRQANARRLEWDDAKVGSKRPRRDRADEVDGEGSDFETDTRSPKRRRMPRPRPAQVVDEWISGEADDDDMNDSAAQQLIDNLQSSPIQRNPPATTPPIPHRSPLVPRSREQVTEQATSSTPRPQTRVPRQATRTPSASPPPSSATEYLTVNAKAKATMRMVAYKNQQVRRPWTVEETERLFEMITLHGCMWAHILKEDQKHPDGEELQARTQVMLKDKARNMKVDYLKAGESLPDGFAAVSIKSSDKQMLRSMGLPYQ